MVYVKLAPWEAFELAGELNVSIQNTIHGSHQAEAERKRNIEELMHSLFWSLEARGITLGIPPMSLVVDQDLNIRVERVALDKFCSLVNRALDGWRLYVSESDWYQPFVSICKL